MYRIVQELIPGANNSINGLEYVNSYDVCGRTYK